MSEFKGKIRFVNQDRKPENRDQSRGAHAEAQLINVIKSAQGTGDKFVLGINKPMCKLCRDAVPATIAEGIEHVDVGYIDNKGNTVTKRLKGLHNKLSSSETGDAVYQLPEKINIKVYEDIFEVHN